MVIATKNIRQYKPNYFMTEEEVLQLWDYTKVWSSKWRLMIGFALFRGLRVGEVCAINLYDFSKDFTRLRVVLEKSHIETELPIIPYLQEIIKDYVFKNKTTFKDGFLFPYYSSRSKNHLSYMTPRTASSCFCKFRKLLGEKYPAFLDQRMAGKVKRYRIGFHSCRRWFETTVYDKIKDTQRLAHIMRYLDSRTVDTYIDPYKVWKEEHNILKASFEEVSTSTKLIDSNQQKLRNYI